MLKWKHLWGFLFLVIGFCLEKKKIPQYPFEKRMCPFHCIPTLHSINKYLEKFPFFFSSSCYDPSIHRGCGLFASEHFIIGKVSVTISKVLLFDLRFGRNSNCAAYCLIQVHNNLRKPLWYAFLRTFFFLSNIYFIFIAGAFFSQ